MAEDVLPLKEPIFLYPYKRSPKAFVEVLLEGPELKPVRESI